MLYLAKELKYIKTENYELCIELISSISKMISGLIKTL